MLANLKISRHRVRRRQLVAIQKCLATLLAFAPDFVSRAILKVRLELALDEVAELLKIILRVLGSQVLLLVLHHLVVMGVNLVEHEHVQQTLMLEIQLFLQLIYVFMVHRFRVPIASGFVSVAVAVVVVHYRRADAQPVVFLRVELPTRYRFGVVALAEAHCLLVVICLVEIVV